MITQAFGARPEYYSQFGLPGHEGIDLSAPTGSPIYAAADGVVSDIRMDGNRDVMRYPYGNQVRISHREGDYITVYAHLQEERCVLGQVVKAGDVIGLADSTGNSSGAHLHFTLKKRGATASGETRYPGDIVNPKPYLE